MKIDNRILIIAANELEVLTKCIGTILSCVKKNCKVKIVFPIKSTKYNRNIFSNLSMNTNVSIECLGYLQKSMLYETEAYEKLACSIREFKPTVIIAHSKQDKNYFITEFALHSYAIASAAGINLKNLDIVKRKIFVLGMSCKSNISNKFKPDILVDTTHVSNEKYKKIACIEPRIRDISVILYNDLHYAKIAKQHGDVNCLCADAFSMITPVIFFDKL